MVVALALAALIGFAGLGVETGLWYAIKRYNQSAADIAAVSGAMEKAGGQAYSDICNLAQRAATANGFTFAGGWSCPAASPSAQSTCQSLTSGEMCVDNPPLFSATGLNGNANYVEVVLARQQSTFFSLLWLPNVMIHTHAIAGLKAFSSCMIALNTSGTDLQNNGTANVNLNQCSFASNSTSTGKPKPSIVFNGNVTFTAGAIATAGGFNVTGNANFIQPPVTPNCRNGIGSECVADPYAGQITYQLPNPAAGPCTTGGTALLPGVYGGTGCTGNAAPMAFTGATTTLCSGIYYLNGEDNQGEALIIGGAGTVVNMGTPGTKYGGVTCPSGVPLGVTIIATCGPTPCSKSSGGGGFIVGGTGANQPTVSLSAPTTADPTGCTQPAAACVPPEILFYQPAATADTKKGNSTLAGGSAVSLNGVVYTPSGQLTLQGNPTLGSCTELIAGNFVIGGTPTMTNPSCGVLTQSVSTLVLAE